MPILPTGSTFRPEWIPVSVLVDGYGDGDEDIDARFGSLERQAYERCIYGN
jgi:hypothetical protein